MHTLDHTVLDAQYCEFYDATVSEAVKSGLHVQYCRRILAILLRWVHTRTWQRRIPRLALPRALSPTMCGSIS